MADQSNYMALDLNNGRKMLYGQDAIKQNIKVLICTLPLSVPLDPELGCKNYTDELIDIVKLDLVRDVIEVLETYEPRITVKQVIPTQADGILTITVHYIDNVTQSPQSFTFNQN